jgi:cytoskeletal protein RodZ
MATVLSRQFDPFGAARFGDFLRSARERRGLTLQQIANETKIPRRLLDALEHGNLDAVPGGMYQRAEIRAYAKAVGLDQALALTELQRALGTPGVVGSDRGTTPPPADATRVRVQAMVATALVAAAALVGLTTTTWNRNPSPSVKVEPSVNVDARRSPPAPRPESGAQTRDAVQASAVGASASVDNIATSSEKRPAVPEPVSTDRAALPTPAWTTDLIVVTEPAGARVTVDGVGRGITPVTIHYLPGGDKRIRVLKEGFASEERSVQLKAGPQPTTLVIPLRNGG